MSLKLDELRKRLLQQPPLSAGAEPASIAKPHTLDSSSLTSRRAKAAERKAGTPSISESLTEAATNAITAVSDATAAEERKLRVSPPMPEHSPFDNPSSSPAISDSAAVQPLWESEALPSQNQMVDAVARVFERTAKFESRFEELGGILAELGRIGASAEELIGPLRAFHDQLAELAESFGPVHALQAHLGRMAETFEPMKVLHDQMSRLADSIQKHLAELIKTLEPAIEFRGRILSLARSFDGVDAMRDSFDEIRSALTDAGRAPLRPE